MLSLLNSLAFKVSQPFGEIAPPAGVADFDAAAGGGIGILIFARTLFNLVTVVGGIFVLFNIVMAGFSLISGEGSKAMEGAREKITYSVVGIIIMVSAYTIMGVIGQLFFNNPTFFLNPEISGPNSSAPSTTTLTVPIAPGATSTP